MPAPTEDADHITVLPNETLADIARRAGVSGEELSTANNLRQPDGTPRPLYAGEVLIRPSAAAPVVAAAPSAAPAATAAGSPPGDRTYQVQPGETLNWIAALFGVTVDALVGRNNLADANTIYAGQVLLIPDAAYVPPAWAHQRVVAAVPSAAPPAVPPAVYEPPTATPVALRIAAMPAAAGGGSDQNAGPAPTLPPAPPTPCPTYVVSGEQWYANQSLSPGQWELIRPDLLDVVLSTCGDVYREIRRPDLPPPTPRPPSAPVTQATVPPGGLDIVIEEPLYRIAVRYGWTVDDLVRANPGLDPTRDNQGRTIHVPAHCRPAALARALSSRRGNWAGWPGRSAPRR
jgi:LysM repeat protein